MCVYMYIHARPRPSDVCYTSMLVSRLTHNLPSAPLQPKTGAMKIHLAKWFDPWLSGGNQFSDAIFTYANKELKELKVRTGCRLVCLVCGVVVLSGVRMHVCVLPLVCLCMWGSRHVCVRIRVG